MKNLRWKVVALCLAVAASTNAVAKPASEGGDPRPPGIGARVTDLDGVVYVDPRGHTLYTSPQDEPGKSNCRDTLYVRATRTFSGITYHFPALEERRTCAQSWPPLLASGVAKPVGDWTIIDRPEGRKQWAFKGKPVYRSVLDQTPGDVNGVTSGPNGPRGYRPLTVDLGFPSGVTTRMTKWGRVLAPEQGSGILYVRDESEIQQASCDIICRSAWKPLLASAMTESRGDWATIPTARGVQQWTFKGKPLFMATRLREDNHLPPAEAPGWKPALYHPRPIPPSDITVTQSAAGLVYADRRGRTVYFFNCVEETPDRQFCDVLGTTPITRVTFCGGPEKCMRNWRPVLASPKAKSDNRTWTVVKVDPKTGGRIDDHADGLSVWAYRGRPLYTYYLDREPGDSYGDGVQLLSRLQVEMITVDFSAADEDR